MNQRSKDKRFLSGWLHKDVCEQVRDIAFREGITQTQFLKWAIERSIIDYEAGNDKPSARDT